MIEETKSYVNQIYSLFRFTAPYGKKAISFIKVVVLLHIVNQIVFGTKFCEGIFP